MRIDKPFSLRKEGRIQWAAAKLDGSGSSARCRRHCERGGGPVHSQSSSVCERSPRMPLPTSPQFKITLGVQNFLFIIPLILTSFSVLLGVGEGGSKGKFLLLIFTTRSPPKSKATYERWLSLHTQDQKLHLFLTQLLLIPKETEE